MQLYRTNRASPCNASCPVTGDGRVDVDGPVGNGVALHKAVSFGLSDRPRNHSELVHETMQRRVCRQESEPA